MNHRTLRERLKALLTGGGDVTAAAISDKDVRKKLDEALEAKVPGYLSVDSVFPEDKQVVYAVAEVGMPSYAITPDDICLHRCSYSIDADENITLGDDAQEVEFKGSFEPVTAAAAHEDCGCKNKAAADNPGADTMKTKTERVAALIAASDNLFSAADQKALETAPEEMLTTLETKFKAASDAKLKAASDKKTVDDAAALKAAEDKKTADQKALESTIKAATTFATVEDYIKAAPAAMQPVLREGIRVAAARKDAVIATIKASARNKFTDEQLAAKDITELETLAELAGADLSTVDFSGQGLPRALSGGADDSIANPPNGYELAIKARKTA